jgi:hypothetical protein
VTARDDARAWLETKPSYEIPYVMEALLADADALAAERDALAQVLATRDEALRYYEGVVCFDSRRALRGGAEVPEVSPEKIGAVMRERDASRQRAEELEAEVKRMTGRVYQPGGLRALGLNVRTLNALDRYGIKTVNELLVLDLDEFRRRANNIGVATVAHIRECLARAALLPPSPLEPR